MRFDARAAKSLKPNTHLIIDGCPGLRLVATESLRSWIYRYKSPVDGRMRQTKIGEWPAMSPVAAAAQWEQLRQARGAGSDVALKKREARSATPAKRDPSAPYLVRELCDDYAHEHLDRHRTSRGSREIRRMLKTMLGSIEHLPAASIQRNQAFQLIESHRHIPSQAKRLRTELGAAWDHAIDAARVPDNTPNWWRQIMRGKLRSKGKKIEGEHIGTKKRVLSPEETGRLINWLPNFSRTVSDAVLLYLWTGTRGAEIVSMEGKEITEEKDGLWWTIPKAKTKNAHHPEAFDHRVPLVGRAEVAVRRRKQLSGDGYLFPKRGGGGHIEQKTVQTGVFYHQPYSKTYPNNSRPRLTVTHWAPHDLRRTVRTMLASMNCPKDAAELIIGHMLEGVEGVYNLYRYDHERREWLTKLSEKLESLSAADIKQ